MLYYSLISFLFGVSSFVSIQAAQVLVDSDQRPPVKSTVSLQSREPNTVDPLVPPSPAPRLTREAAFYSAEALIKVRDKGLGTAGKNP